MTNEVATKRVVEFVNIIIKYYAAGYSFDIRQTPDLLKVEDLTEADFEDFFFPARSHESSLFQCYLPYSCISLSVNPIYYNISTGSRSETAEIFHDDFDLFLNKARPLIIRYTANLDKRVDTEKSNYWELPFLAEFEITYTQSGNYFGPPDYSFEISNVKAVQLQDLK